MAPSTDGDAPMKVKAALVDPATMRVVWLNESAATGLGLDPGADPSGVPLESIVPAATGAAPREVLSAVAASGQPRHLRADMLANRQGALAMLTSIHRLPDGMLLVLTESSFIAGGESQSSDRPRGRRSR